MTTDPMHNEQPSTTSPKVVAGLCVCTAIAALAALWNILETPGRPFHGILLTVSISALVGVAAFAVGGLALAIAAQFKDRDTAHEAAEAEHRARVEREIADQAKHRARVEQVLEHLAAQIAETRSKQETILTTVNGLVKKSQQICKHHKEIQLAISECDQRITVIARDVDAIGEAFVETGTQRRPVRQPHAA